MTAVVSIFILLLAAWPFTREPLERQTVARSERGSQDAGPFGPEIAVAAEAAEKGGQPSLAVVLFADQTTYRRTEDIVFVALLVNTSSVGFYVDRRLNWNYSANDFDLNVTDMSTGESLVATALGDRFPPPPKVDDLVRLDPGQAFGLRRSYPIKDLPMPKPGPYRLTVEYVSLLRPQDSFGLPVWIQLPGKPLVSNPVEIVLRD